MWGAAERNVGRPSLAPLSVVRWCSAQMLCSETWLGLKCHFKFGLVWKHTLHTDLFTHNYLLHTEFMLFGFLHKAGSSPKSQIVTFVSWEERGSSWARQRTSQWTSSYLCLHGTGTTLMVVVGTCWVAGDVAIRWLLHHASFDSVANKLLISAITLFCLASLTAHVTLPCCKI